MTPLMVSSPVITPCVPSTAMAVERNVAVGWRTTSKKSADRRWSSRVRSPDDTEAMSMVTSTCESARRSPIVAAPSMPVNRPRHPRQPEVATDEGHVGVARVDAPDAGAGQLDAVDVAGRRVGAVVVGRGLDLCAHARNSSDACVRTQVLRWSP